jgi:Asp-tRNA(Asn)/Glu-tRNA(Gln) amidotransferase B subunit
MTQIVDMTETLRRHRMPVVEHKTDDVDAETLKRQAEARKFFNAYRAMMHPKLLTNWWTKEISFRLQWFYEDLMAGKRPKLALEAPPQHGKSARTRRRSR